MTRPRLAILDYGIGNLHSALQGFDHAGATVRLTADRRDIEAADGVVLPGVGAFGPCVDALRTRGIDQIALERVASGVPFFGICIGMQLLFNGSEEADGHSGLGVFDRRIVRLPGGVKRPQMQWNMLRYCDAEHPMFTGLGEEAWVYFVHSYSAEPGDDVLATCAYGGDLVAAVGRDNVWACQFHPEKSGRTGIRILENFVALAGAA